MRSFTKYTHDATLMPLSIFQRVILKKTCAVAKRLDAVACIPATSSNFSVRCGQFILISRSGIHKRLVTARDFVRINLSGNPVRNPSPKASAETLLHTLIYNLLPNMNCVLHCHPIEIEKINLPGVKFAGHELLKVLGFENHSTNLFLESFANEQDMKLLAAQVEKHAAICQKNSSLKWGIFVIANHGIYCAGETVDQAEARLEAILHLLKIN